MKAFALALLVAAAPLAATAGPLPAGGITAQTVASVLQDRGYRAAIDKDSVGDPRITSGSDGVTWYVFFYECDADKVSCKSLQFGSAFDMDDGSTPERMNDWNRRYRFGQAQVDEEKDPSLKLDMDVQHGTSTEAIAATLDRWTALNTAFIEHIGFRK